MIAVAASTPNNALATYSTTGAYVTLAAPGGIIPKTNNPCSLANDDCVISLWLGDQVAEASGTSQAAPHVTGVVALMLSANPDLKPFEIKGIISSVNNVTPFSSQPNRPAGNGIVNAEKAVLGALALLGR